MNCMWFRSLFQGASPPVCVQGQSQESPRPPGLPAEAPPTCFRTVGPIQLTFPCWTVSSRARAGVRLSHHRASPAGLRLHPAR